LRTLSEQSRQALPRVAILLCTYHGQHYLADQFDSFAAQTYPNWEIWASDDGSQDDTHTILESYRRKWGEGRLSIHIGPALGFAANFQSLTCKASIQADCYAYSDQDDVWEKDKLQRAVQWLNAAPKDVPALYCSRTRLVDANNQDLGFSPLFCKPPSFANALMQNIGGGNTMVFNNAARKLLCEVGESIDVVSHDWWAYIVIAGCGGRVLYDPYPSVRYRQHNGNLVGTNSTWHDRFIRIRMLWAGRFRDWSDRNITGLKQIHNRLTPESRDTLERFAAARKRSLILRLVGLKRSGVYRQTLLGNIGLIVAAILNRI
jgi:glycosyltransferase involved in cell wall biosynthesis